MSETWLVTRRVVVTSEYDHDGKLIDTRRHEYTVDADGSERLIVGTVTDPDGREVSRYGPADETDEVTEST